jgi:outer membrane lipoprotein carrier protein
MKYLILLTFFVTLSFASLGEIDSFEADFTQSITDDKGKKLTYTGHIIASKPQSALWNYIKPVKKDIYISEYSVTIIEPEIEQVIIRKISSNFDIFKLIKNAKEIEKNRYLTTYKNTKFSITTKNNLIKSISYIDEFDNNVEIIFKNQKQNKEINKEIFYPNIPVEYDIVRD